MGSELLGLSFGEALAHHYPGGNILFGVMSNAPTLKEALEKFCRYHDIMADAVKPALTVTDEWVHFSFEVVVNSSLAAPKEISEVLLATYAVILRRLTNGKLKLEEVRCRHSKPSDIRLYNQTFHAPVSFEQRRNEVIFARAYLDLPIFLSDPRLLAALEELAESILKELEAPETWSSRVVGLLGTATVQGEIPTIANISSRLGMSARSLQQRLKREGQTFRSLLNRIRKRIAMDVLDKNRMDLCELAFLLGYSEQSAFNHAFKRWTGRTPMQYRKNL
jgi:AraC-like DNA-binding protein